MSEAKIVKNIETKLNGYIIGYLLVKWDLKCYIDSTETDHSDNWITVDGYVRHVETIRSITYKILDQKGIDLIEHFKGNTELTLNLQALLLDAVCDDSIEELETKDYSISSTNFPTEEEILSPLLSILKGFKNTRLIN